MTEIDWHAVYTDYCGTVVDTLTARRRESEKLAKRLGLVHDVINSTDTREEAFTSIREILLGKHDAMQTMRQLACEECYGYEGGVEYRYCNDHDVKWPHDGSQQCPIARNADLLAMGRKIASDVFPDVTVKITVRERPAHVHHPGCGPYTDAPMDGVRNAKPGYCLEGFAYESVPAEKSQQFPVLHGRHMPGEKEAKELPWGAVWVYDDVRYTNGRDGWSVDTLFVYMKGERPRIGDRIYAGDENRTEDFITVVRSVNAFYLTTAGWPEQRFPIRHCMFVERGKL